MTSVVKVVPDSIDSAECHFRIGCYRSRFLVFPFRFDRSYVSDYFEYLPMERETAVFEAAPYHL